MHDLQYASKRSNVTTLRYIHSEIILLYHDVADNSTKLQPPQLQTQVAATAAAFVQDVHLAAGLGENTTRQAATKVC